MLRVGLIGPGDIGAHLGRLAREIEGVALAGVAGGDRDKAARAAAALGAAAFDDHQQLLEALRPDAVIVASPSFTHREIVLDALAAGCHVFCEKPLAQTVPDCDEMIAAAGRAGLRLGVGHVLRYMPLFQKAQQSAANLGSLRLVELVRLEKPEVWGWYRRTCGLRSLLHEVGVHELDLLRLLAGEPQRVRLVAAPPSRPELDYPDTLQARFDFVSGAVGSLSLSWNSPLTVARGYLVGERGALHYDWRAGRLEVALADGRPESVSVEQTTDPYRIELEAFFAWVRGGAPPPVTAEDGRAAVALAEAALRSLETGQAQPVAAPPETG
jgi:UDP-N-acetylglucosamine 3-dehydrogenase